VYDDSSDWHTVSSSVGTAERVEDLEEDFEVAVSERVGAQYDGGDVGWSSTAQEKFLQASSGTTDEALQQHLKANYDAGALAKLTNIDLTNTQVTDAAVAALANTCPGLQVICLNNTHVTDAAATALANARPGLEVITLDNTQVTDAAVTALANACPDLQVIFLSNTQVTPSLAKWWLNDANAELKQHPDYGGTIDDFHKQLRLVTNMRKKGRARRSEKRRWPARTDR
jgi:Leucine-rich repeat (LRR) protein